LIELEFIEPGDVAKANRHQEIEPAEPAFIPLAPEEAV